MADLKLMWRITMRGIRGYHCETLVSMENAPLRYDAMCLAEEMFPELVISDVKPVAVPDYVEPSEVPS